MRTAKHAKSANKISVIVLRIPSRSSLISPDFLFFQQDFLVAFPSRTSPASRLRVKPSQKPFRAGRFSNSVAALAALCVFAVNLYKLRSSHKSDA
jgi:hypothetical protein